MVRRPIDYPRREWFAMSRERRKERVWELRDNLRLIAIFERVSAICERQGNTLLGMAVPAKAT